MTVYSMDESVYDDYYRLEREHWWNLARKDILFATLKQYYPDFKNGLIADIGSGTGSFLEEFQRMHMKAEGHDSSPSAIAYMKKCFSFKIVQKKFPDDYTAEDNNQYDAILLLDVLEHLEDDKKGIRTVLNLLKQGGILICTVPACPQMWSEYDIIMEHKRRYGHLNEIRSLVDPVQGKIRKLSYFSMFLFPGLFLVRFIENILFSMRNCKAKFRPHFVPEIFNMILFAIFHAEKYLLRYLNLPYGSSMLMVVEKK